MKKKLLFSFILLFFCAFAAMAQSTIEGKVLDEKNNEPIPGAVVFVKGSESLATPVSAVDGTFKLENVPAGATIVVRAVGYGDKEFPANAVPSVITIASNTDLDEVVVTGLGIKENPKTLSYKPSVVKGDDLVKVGSPENALTALQSKVAGINFTGSTGSPGSPISIVARGNSSFQQSNQVLLVVDGIPYDNTQTNTGNTLLNGAAFPNRGADIDPNNIESVTFLPSSTATTRYGSRGANGVLLITTKTASKGTGQFRASYNFSMNFERPWLPKFQNTYGNGADASVAGDNGYNEFGEPIPDFTYFIGNWGPRFSDIDRVPHPLKRTDVGGPSYVTYADLFPELPDSVDYVAHPDNVRDFFDTGVQAQHSLSLSGGTQDANFNTTISRLDYDGIVPGTFFDKTTLAFGANVQATEKLSVGMTGTYTRTEQRTTRQGANNAVGSFPDMGRLLFTPRSFDLSGIPFTNPVDGTSVYYRGDIDNPNWSVRNNNRNSKLDRLALQFSASYDITDWLRAGGRAGLNNYTERRQVVGAVGSVTNNNGLGSINESQIVFTEMELYGYLELQRNITPDINVKALLGYNYNSRENDVTGVTGSPSAIPNLNTINNSAEFSGSGFLTRRRLHGIFGDVTVGYKNIAFITIGGRNDWSSTLPEDNNSFFYNSIGGSFNFTEIIDIPDNILTSGKLRANWGRTGQDAPIYSVVTTFGINPNFGNNASNITFPVNGISGLSLSDVAGNTNLSPEFTREWEIGTDLDFWNDKIRLNFTYYDRLTTDILASVTVPGPSGSRFQTVNAGEVSNKGIEITLGATPVTLENGFTWNVNAVFTRNRNIVEKIPDGQDLITFGTGFTGGVSTVFAAGQPYGQFRGSTFARHNGQLLIDDVGLPFVDPNAEQVVVGDPNPDFITSLTNTFSYKGVTLNILWDWTQGGDLWSQTGANLLQRGVTIDTEDRGAPYYVDGILANTETSPVEPLLNGDGSTIQNNIPISTNQFWFRGATVADEAIVFDATVFRLREIALSYTFPQNLVEKTPFAGVTVGLVGRNLWFFAPGIPEGLGIDPDRSTTGASNQQGLDFTTVPNTRRYGFNVGLTF